MMTAMVKLSHQGQVLIPKEVCDSLHWSEGVELMLVTTEYGLVLQAKTPEPQKLPAKSLRGFLQHTGEPVPTDVLCQAVEYHEHDRV